MFAISLILVLTRYGLIGILLEISFLIKAALVFPVLMLILAVMQPLILIRVWLERKGSILRRLSATASILLTCAVLGIFYFYNLIGWNF